MIDHLVSQLPRDLDLETLASASIRSKHGDPTGRSGASFSTEIVLALEGATPDDPVELGRYSVLRRLGAGAMGVVYEALDPDRGLTVALKTLHQLEASALVRFKQEFRRVAPLHHRNLVALHELASNDGQWFFTMEFIDGVDFISHVRGVLSPTAASETDATASPAGFADTVLERETEAKRGSTHTMARPGGPPEAKSPTLPTPHPALSLPLASAPKDEARLRSALTQLAAGIHALHDAGILHLDIKPANIMVDHAGRVVILDFGIAQVLRATRNQPDAQTISGTPAYMAPEQVAMRTPAEAADWYAFGGVLYHALTGRLPFEGRAHTMMVVKQDTMPPRPSMIAADVPADLEALCMAALATDPTHRPSGAEILRALGVEVRDAEPPEHALFVGREGVMSRLWDCSRACSDGVPVVARVRGVSGMGKSAALDRFIEQLEASGAVVLRGRCYEREAVPYNAFDRLIDELARALAARPEAPRAALSVADVAALRRVFPVLGSFPAASPGDDAPDPAPSTIDAPRTRRRAFSALREILRALAQAHPLALYIDDAQWSDDESARLLSALLEPPGPPPALFLISYRTDELTDSPMLEGLRRTGDLDPHVRIDDIEVGPLAEDESRALCQALLGREDPPLVSAIIGEAEGSPLFIEELVQLALTTPGKSAELPRAPSLPALIGRRLLALASETRSVVELLAVVGRPIAQSLVFRAAGFSRDRVPTLYKLQREHLVRIRGIHGDDAIECYHDRIREAVQDQLDAGGLRACHRALASCLEAAGVLDPEVLARHHHGAGDLDRAGPYALQAAASAAEALAFDHAAQRYADALAWLPELAPARRRELQEARAEALANAGRTAAAAEAFLECASGSATAEALALRRRAAELFLIGGEIDRGVNVLRPLLSEVGIRYPESTASALLSLLGTLARLRIRGFAHEIRPDEQIPTQDIARMEVCLAAGKGFTSFSPVFGGMFSLAGLHQALRSGHARGIARGLAYYGLMTGYPATARAIERADLLFSEGEKIAAQLADPYLEGFLRLGRGVATIASGAWEPGLAHLAAAQQLFERCVGVVWERRVAYSSTVMALIWRGHLANGGELTVRWLQQCEDAGDFYASLMARTASALTLIRGGDTEGAQQVMDEAMARWTTNAYTVQHLVTLRFSVYCELACGRPERALERISSQWDALRGSRLLDLQLMRFDALTLRADACVAVAAVDTKRRASLLRRAERDAKKLAREARDYTDASAAMIRAGIASVRDEHELAAQACAEAIAAYERGDMALHATCARRRQAQLRGPAGREQILACDDDMHSEGIAEPERWADIYAPGRWPAP